MTTSECILALDFDGVVWDSVGESYYVARLAWEKLFGPLPDGIEPAFRTGRWLVRTGHDFYLLLRLLKDNPHEDFGSWTKEAFKSRLADCSEAADTFDRVFYATRDEERTSHPAHWLALQAAYPTFLAAFPHLQRAFRDIVITTTKDEASVHFLLHHAGIELTVLGKEFTREKADQVRWLSQSHHVPLQNVLLLDDLIDNLTPVRAIGSQVALAAWGYNTPAEQQQAQADGIPLIHDSRILEDLSAACN